MGPVAPTEPPLCNPLGLSWEVSLQIMNPGGYGMPSEKLQSQPMVQCPFNDFFFCISELGLHSALFFYRTLVCSQWKFACCWMDSVIPELFFLTVLAA